jgi:predicted enzyme related to lactoylglutathione lyase
MIELGNAASGRFCWIDLAATDADRAKAFYGNLFGWSSHEQPANGGNFTRLRLGERDVGSMYQLRQSQLDHGVPSHWTPYIRVDDVDDVVRRAVALGGRVIVQPFAVSDIARIALILDSVGAHVGLWEPIVNATGTTHG